jgi:hypothetical protein
LLAGLGDEQVTVVIEKWSLVKVPLKGFGKKTLVFQ